MKSEFMRVRISCGDDVVVTASWSNVSGFSPYHPAIKLLRQLSVHAGDFLRSEFMRCGDRMAGIELSLSDLERHGVDVMAQIMRLEVTPGSAGGVMFTSFGGCGMKGCRWVFSRWDENVERLLPGELVALLVTAGGVTSVVQTVDGDSAELVRRLFDWMGDESE